MTLLTLTALLAMTWIFAVAFYIRLRLSAPVVVPKD